MLREEKNIKDSVEKPMASYTAGTQDMSLSLSYTKTNKLITALYMVTDILEKDEPLRNKLRTLGTEIISDMNYTPSNICNKISEIMSFLDIASAVNIISSMNCNILKKEFLELNQSVLSSQGEKEFIDNFKTINRQIDLSEFFREEFSLNPSRPPLIRGGVNVPPDKGDKGGLKERGNLISKGHTSIGVQKGSTLLKALSDKINPEAKPHGAQDFNKLKKQRREDIINIIKTIGGNATIKDIKDRAKNLPNKTSSLLSCGEKTLQRELVSMVKDSVLNKVGEKRWSRYFLK